MDRRTAEKYRERLRAGRWFHDLPEELQEKLVSAGQVRSFAPEQALFLRGDPPNGIFGVLDGAIRIAGMGNGGKASLLALAEAPQWFGETSVIDEGPRSHDAIAESEALVVHVPQMALASILSENPELWRHLGSLVAAKLRLAFMAVEDIALLPIPIRLARRLVLIAERYGEWRDRSSRVLDLKQDQLALMLSVSRQTVNQILKDLATQGLLRVSYGQIEIIDIDGLRREAALEIVRRP